MTVWDIKEDSDCDRHWMAESVVSRVSRLLLPTIWSNGFCTTSLRGFLACCDYTIHQLFLDCNNFFRANLWSKSLMFPKKLAVRFLKT